jgi:hypothetical protein
MALHQGAFKTVLLCTFLQSIGIYLPGSTPTYEHNQGTIKLIRTNHLTDTHAENQATMVPELNE